MKKLFSAADPMEAHLVRGLLEEAGITAVVQGEALWSARGELPFGPNASPTIFVKAEDVERAQTIVIEYELRGREVPARCPECDYDLSQSPGPACPECGWQFRRKQELLPWQCPNCEQELDAQFTDCWNCGTERPWPPAAREI